MPCIFQTTRPVGGSGCTAWLWLPLGCNSILIILLVQTLKKYNNPLKTYFISPWSSTLLLITLSSLSHGCQSSCNRMSTLPLTLYRCPRCPSHYTEHPHCLYVVGFKKGQSLPILPTEQGHVCWALARTQSQIACLSNSPKPRGHWGNDRLCARESPVHCHKKARCASTDDTYPGIAGKPSQDIYEGRQVGSDTL